jgi:P-aminobenzoate N-oxygenase AurF
MSREVPVFGATAARAAQLVLAAERRSFDPFREIDWQLPIDDSSFHLAPQTLPLYGTGVWMRMGETERRAYSRHECASLCAAGIWFENILMHCVVDHLYDLPADDGAHRFLLVETADECRHSAMFGEYVRRAGTPAYPPHAALRTSGRLMKATTTRSAAYIAILAAEELLDASNRATTAAEDVHPIPRAMARIHVIEEARHMAFARTYLEEAWPRLDRITRARAVVAAPFVVRCIAEALVNPAVYQTLGIAGGWRVAHANPHRRRLLRRDLAPLVAFLHRLGAIPPPARPLWQRLGLAGALPPREPERAGGATSPSPA